MNRTMIYTFAGALVAALLTSTAYANPIDKGSLGQYERQGRFVKPVLTPAARTTVRERAASLTNGGSTVIDKGALGKYERQGRFLRPVIESVQNNWATGDMAENHRTVMHVHGLDGKEHRNVKLGLPIR